VGEFVGELKKATKTGGLKGPRFAAFQKRYLPASPFFFFLGWSKI
jgi:hypothetical protein